MSPDLSDPSTIVLFSLALLVAGAAGGFIAGLLGVGGGIVIVPALFFLLTALDVSEAIRMHVAVGSSLSTIVVTSLISARSHNKRGTVDFDLLKEWGPGVVVGVFAGSAVAAFIDGETLTGIFAVIAFIMAFYMAFGRSEWRIAERPPRGLVGYTMSSVIGAISALMGIGGGTLSVPLLSLFNFPIHRAVGTAAAIGCLIGIPGTLGFMIAGWGEPDLPRFSIGYVNLLALALVMPTSMIFAPLGARAAHALPVRGLRLAFAFFLAATALRMFLSALG